MTVKERVYAFIDFKGISVKKFEELCSLSNGYVSSMRKGFGEDKLNNVLKMFPELNRDWLIYGEGEMLCRVVQNNQNGDNINGNSVTIHKQDGEMVDVIRSLVAQLSTNQQQISKNQEQIDRLITLIENKL